MFTQADTFENFSSLFIFGWLVGSKKIAQDLQETFRNDEIIT